MCYEANNTANNCNYSVFVCFVGMLKCKVQWTSIMRVVHWNRLKDSSTKNYLKGSRKNEKIYDYFDYFVVFAVMRM